METRLLIPLDFLGGDMLHKGVLMSVLEIWSRSKLSVVSGYLVSSEAALFSPEEHAGELL